MSETPSFKKLFDPIQDGLKQVEADIRAGNLKAAAERLNLLQREAPRDARIFFMGTSLAEAAGNPAAALQSAERAVSFYPTWAPAHIELAGVLLRQGNVERALEVADKAVSITPPLLPVLELATSIANTANDPERVGRYLTAAHKLAPENLSVRRSLAFNLLDLGKVDDAWEMFTALMKIEPDNPVVRLGRGRAALARGDLPTASQDFKVLTALDPTDEVFAYYAVVAEGGTPATQPDVITQITFDGYARRFDAHLVTLLKYRVPKRIAEIIRARYPDLAITVLDLGCGTGLVGLYLGRPQGGLVGVDLSPNMIAEAAKHNLYDRFHQVSLIDALRETPTAEFEVITAADVFIYVGEIEQAVKDARRVLRDNGAFVFSCEATQANEPDLVLRQTMRYAHSESSVRAMCEAAGFKSVEIEAFDIRNEANAPVAGFIVHAST